MIRRWLKTLEREARGEEIVVPQMDGSEDRFPRSEMSEAFLHELARLKGEHEEPPHPLTVAMTRSSDPTLRSSALAALTGVDEDGHILPPQRVPDLSE